VDAYTDCLKVYARLRRRLSMLESGKIYFGTAQRGSSLPNWKEETQRAVAELKVDILVRESVLRSFERQNKL
jgi:hypothetical protein